MRTRIALVAAVPAAVIAFSIPATTAPAAPVATGHSQQSVHTDSLPFTAVLLAARLRTPLPAGSAGLLLDPGALSVSSVRSTAVTARVPPAVAPAPVQAVAPVPTSTSTPAPPTASGPVDTVTPAQQAQWERVAMCEEGGNWQANGPAFSGGLGISRANWDAFGGLQFAPEGAMATPDQQIMVAERIQAYPPDQYGCQGW
ncbi:MAG: transglycosylase family protein [Acidimicrobiales bacterium]